MKRCVPAAWLLMAVWVMSPGKADAVGPYENAATESAFFLSPDTVVVRATLDAVTAPRNVEATIYRVFVVVPVHNSFRVGVEQPIVSVSRPSGIDSGMGDLLVRVSARLFGRPGRAFLLTSSLGTGTGEHRFFPYATQSVDFTLGAAWTDSIGTLAWWATAGNVWTRRVPDELEGEKLDYGQFGVGVGVPLGPRIECRAGAVHLNFEASNAHREMLFAAAGYRWTPALRVFVEGQAETGPVGDRASDWALILGASVWF